MAEEMFSEDLKFYCYLAMFSAIVGTEKAPHK